MTERESKILSNIPLVHYVLKHMTVNSNEYDDLTSEGIIGLINAVDYYDKNKNTAFSTYAYACIKNQMLYYLNKPRIKCISLNTEVGEGITLEDVIVDDESYILEKLVYKELIASIRNIIKNILSEEERYLIYSLYGINYEKKNQSELANEFNIKQGTISKWHNSLVKKVKNMI